VRAANSSAKMVARLITVLIVIAAIIGVYWLLSPFWKAANNPEPYKTAMAEEWKDRIQPNLETELKDSFETAVPEIGKLIVQQLKDNEQKAMATIDAQATLLMENLQQYTETKLADTVVEVEAVMAERLAKMVPDMTDPDTRELVMGNAAVALEGAVSDIVEEKLGRHIKTLSNIETKLIQFPVPDPIQQMSDTELSEELNRALSEYALLTLRQLMTPETKEMLRDLAKDSQ
jgi:hypothetical protein